MKNILVTGAGGFLGTRLSELLREKYSGAANIILLTSVQKEGFLCVEHKDYKFDAGDFLGQGIEKIDVLIHLGGYVARKTSDERDAEKQYSTLVNTNYLLQHLPSVPGRIIYCSTIMVYDDYSVFKEGTTVIDENTFPQPANHYGLVKYCCEFLIREYAKEHGILSQILRLGPLYGIGDKRKNMMMTMISQAVRGENLHLWENPKKKRNLLYVDDCCRFIIKCLESEEDIGVINVGSSQNVSMMELVNTIISATGNRVTCKISDSNEPGGSDIMIDDAKRKKYLGTEQVSFYEGIKKTCQWVRARMDEGECG